MGITIIITITITTIQIINTIDFAITITAFSVITTKIINIVTACFLIILLLPKSVILAQSFKGYCRWNHENCQKKSSNKYHHYWHFTAGQNKILKEECKNLPQIYFMKDDDEWVKSAIVWNEKFHLKDSLPLVETGNGKSSYLFV